MNQCIVSVDIESALVPLDADAFLPVVLAGLHARAGNDSVARADCEGFCVPDLAWDHPMNQGLYALQREARALRFPQAQVLGAVLRFTALSSPVVDNPALASFVDRGEDGQVMSLDEFLTRAAATAVATLGADKLCHFDVEHLAAEAVRHRHKVGRRGFGAGADRD